jgi:phosphate transport system permease protein
MNRLAYRKFVNSVMLAATGVCTFITVAMLFVILGYLVYNGGKSIDWNFLTKLPLPPGQTGGGMANAMVGSAMMVGIAALIGLPVGFL